MQREISLTKVYAYEDLSDVGMWKGRLTPSQSFPDDRIDHYHV